MDLKKEISFIAERKIREGFQFIASSPVQIPEDVKSVFERALNLIKGTLDLDDPITYRNIYVVLKVQECLGESNELLIRAKAKLVGLICDEIKRLEINRYVDNKFDDSTLLRLFPALKEKMDDEGLLPVSIFDKILLDAVEFEGHALFPLLPNRLATQLLSMKLANPTIDLKIRLDHYKVFPIADYRPAMNEEFVYGPPFNKKHLITRLHNRNIPTVLARFPRNDLEREKLALMAEVEKFEVNRNEKSNGLISMSAEELPPLNEKHIDVGYVETKLFHSTVNLEKDAERIEHADYTKLIYKVDGYDGRLKASIKDKVDAAGHFKLFWIGNITIENWVNLFKNVFEANELAVEYLTGEK